MPEPAAAQVRYRAIVSSGGEMQIRSHAPDVASHEVGRTLLRAALALLEAPNQRCTTVAEIEELQHRQQTTQLSPATRMYVRGEDQVWLGDVAHGAVGARLLERGFLDCGRPPKDVKRPCDRALDERAFDETYLEDPKGKRKRRDAKWINAAKGPAAPVEPPSTPAAAAPAETSADVPGAPAGGSRRAKRARVARSRRPKP